MPLTRTQLGTEEARNVWDQVICASSTATFFHTQSWAQILGTTFPGWRPAPIAVRFSNGNLALVPQMRKSLFPFASYGESMLPGVYGGPLFLHEPAEDEWRVLWSIISKVPNIVMLGNPYLTYAGAPNAERRPTLTSTIDLTPGYTKVKSGYHKRYRTYINAAHRQSLQINVASSMEEVEGYYSAYKTSLERWGKQARGFYPKKLFTNLFAHPSYASGIKLWTCTYEGKVLAGAWIFYHGKYAIYWHGAMDAEFSKYRPMHALLDAAIEDACRGGFQWFDLNPSGGLDGVDQFKAGFGAQHKEFYTYRRLDPVGRAFRFYRHMVEHYLHTSSL
jgi:hypothetical protein